MEHVTVRRVGDALVVAIPADLLERYNLKEGDTLRVAPGDHGLVLLPGGDRLARQAEAARLVMDQNAEALDLLAR